MNILPSIHVSKSAGANIVTDDPKGMVGRIRLAMSTPNSRDFATKVADDINEKEDDTKRSQETWKRITWTLNIVIFLPPSTIRSYHKHFMRSFVSYNLSSCLWSYLALSVFTRDQIRNGNDEL